MTSKYGYLASIVVKIRLFGLNCGQNTVIWPHLTSNTAIWPHLTSNTAIWPQLDVKYGHWPQLDVKYGHWPQYCTQYCTTTRTVPILHPVPLPVPIPVLPTTRVPTPPTGRSHAHGDTTPAAVVADKTCSSGFFRFEPFEGCMSIRIHIRGHVQKWRFPIRFISHFLEIRCF